MALQAKSGMRITTWPALTLLIIMSVFALAPAFGFISLMPISFSTNRFFVDGILSSMQLYALRETIVLLIGVGVLVSLIGIGAAWMVALYTFPLRKLLDIGLILPLAFPTYIAAYVAVDALDFFGPVQAVLRWITGAEASRNYLFLDMRSLPGAIIVLGLVLFPYVYVPARIVFSQTGRNILDAARLLGVTGFRLFWRIGLPLIRPAWGAGLVLALLETLNDLGAVEHLGISSLSLVIRDLWLNRGDLPGAARLAGILLVAVGMVMLFSKQGRDAINASRAPAHPRAIPLKGGVAMFTTCLLAIPVLAGFALPVLFLLWRVWQYAPVSLVDYGFVEAAIASLGVAVSVSCLVTAFGALLAISIRLQPKLGIARRFIGFGYAVPGTVLVLAVLPVLRLADDGLEAMGINLLLSGSIFGVLYVLCVRFLTLGSTQAQLALERLPRNLDHVAQVHGYGNAKLAFGLHLPAMLPGLTFGAILVFIDTIKELPATILLRPFNFETLATRAYAKAGAGLFEHAALESLLIVLFSGIAAYLFAQKRG